MSQNWAQKRWALRKGAEADSHEGRPLGHVWTGVIFLVFAVIFFLVTPIIGGILYAAAGYQFLVAAIVQGVREAARPLD